jgi:poly(3-hydroxybutyrate) depolymerase
MRTLRSLIFALLFSGVSLGQAARSVPPQTVEIASGNLRLKAFLWKPPGPGPFPAVLFNHGSGTDAAHTAGMPITEAAEKLAPLFL